MPAKAKEVPMDNLSAEPVHGVIAGLIGAVWLLVLLLLLPVVPDGAATPTRLLGETGELPGAAPVG
jgi:hypothetical protein